MNIKLVTVNQSGINSPTLSGIEGVTATREDLGNFKLCISGGFPSGTLLLHNNPTNSDQSTGVKVLSMDLINGDIIIQQSYISYDGGFNGGGGLDGLSNVSLVILMP